MQKKRLVFLLNLPLLQGAYQGYSCCIPSFFITWVRASCLSLKSATGKGTFDFITIYYTNIIPYEVYLSGILSGELKPENQ